MVVALFVVLLILDLCFERFLLLYMHEPAVKPGESKPPTSNSDARQLYKHIWNTFDTVAKWRYA
jgi:hypothetical protein